MLSKQKQIFCQNLQAKRKRKEKKKEKANVNDLTGARYRVEL
jgi:hypothetical protein